MPPTPQYLRLFAKLSRAAERDSQALLKALPKEIKERVAGVQIRFMDKPTPAMIERGTQDDALSVTDRVAGEIIVFVMTLIERYGRDPAEYRQAFRRTLLQELAAWAGTEWLGGE